MIGSGQPFSVTSLRLAPRFDWAAVTFWSISWAWGSLPVTSITIANADLPGRGNDQPDRHVSAGHALHVVQRQPQPLVDARPAGLELAVDVLGEGLHHRVGHQVAKLGGVPVLLERVDIRDGEEALRGVGQQRFAGTDRLGRYALDAARQQHTASTARDPNPETRHCTTPCVSWQAE